MTKQLQLFLVALFVRQTTAAPTTCRSGATINFSLGDCAIRSPSMPDIHSWGFNLKFQDAGEVCMVPSTVTNATFVTADGICSSQEQLQANGVPMSEAACNARRGGKISTQKLKTGNLERLGRNPGWKMLGNAIDKAVEVSVKLFQQTITTTVGVIDKGQQSTASHFGLASDSTILRDSKKSGLIGAISFGLNVGSQSFWFPRLGSLVLGGYDSNSVDSSSFIEFPIKKDDRLYDRRCPLQVQITDLTFKIKRVNETAWINNNTMAGPGNPLIACIEPYDNLFRLPGTMISPVKDFINRVILESNVSSAFLSPTAYGNKVINLEPGLVWHKVSGQFNTTLRFTLQPEGSDDSLTVDIPQHEFQGPLRGLDENGAVKVDTEYTELQIYGDPAPGDATVLGKVFLSQVYLFVDYDRGKFYMAPLKSQSTSPFPVSSSCARPLTATDKGVLAVGLILGVLLLIAIGFFVWKKYRRPSRATDAAARLDQRDADSRGRLVPVNRGPPEDGIEVVNESAAPVGVAGINGPVTPPMAEVRRDSELQGSPLDQAYTR
ncbi:hypothetical protein QBC43DRAFT_218865 [Cladorrhinum sp. PSN259]|nr:hypothetical protein QBC43DRAFT_218865 [Cladorrhinum sp. PSN259]